jgi:hypothetical protein
VPEPAHRVALEVVLGREQRLDGLRLVHPAHADLVGARAKDGVQAVEPFGAGLPLGPAALDVRLPFQDLLSDMVGKLVEVGLGCGAPRGRRRGGPGRGRGLGSGRRLGRLGLMG